MSRQLSGSILNSHGTRCRISSIIHMLDSSNWKVGTKRGAWRGIMYLYTYIPHFCERKDVFSNIPLHSAVTGWDMGRLVYLVPLRHFQKMKQNLLPCGVSFFFRVGSVFTSKIWRNATSSAWTVWRTYIFPAAHSTTHLSFARIFWKLSEFFFYQLRFLPSGFFFLGSSTALFQNFRDNDVFLQASCVDILVYLSNHSRLIFTRRPVIVCRNKLITSYYLLQLPQPTAAKACLVSHTLSSPSSSSQFHKLSPQIALCPTM